MKIVNKGITLKKFIFIEEEIRDLITSIKEETLELTKLGEREQSKISSFKDYLTTPTKDSRDNIFNWLGFDKSLLYLKNNANKIASKIDELNLIISEILDILGKLVNLNEEEIKKYVSNSNLDQLLRDQAQTWKLIREYLGKNDSFALEFLTEEIILDENLERSSKITELLSKSKFNNLELFNAYSNYLKRKFKEFSKDEKLLNNKEYFRDWEKLNEDFINLILVKLPKKVDSDLLIKLIKGFSDLLDVEKSTKKELLDRFNELYKLEFKDYNELYEYIKNGYLKPDFVLDLIKSFKIPNNKDYYLFCFMKYLELISKNERSDYYNKNNYFRIRNNLINFGKFFIRDLKNKKGAKEFYENLNNYSMKYSRRELSMPGVEFYASLFSFEVDNNIISNYLDFFKSASIHYLNGIHNLNEKELNLIMGSKNVSDLFSVLNDILKLK